MTVQDAETHLPMRPSWDCGACGQPWPCAPAKVGLSEEYMGNRTGLLLYVAAQMWSAIDDAYANAKAGPQPVGLRDRFLDWVRPRGQAA